MCCNYTLLLQHLPEDRNRAEQSSIIKLNVLTPALELLTCCQTSIKAAHMHLLTDGKADVQHEHWKHGLGQC